MRHFKYKSVQNRERPRRGSGPVKPNSLFRKEYGNKKTLFYKPYLYRGIEYPVQAARFLLRFLGWMCV